MKKKGFALTTFGMRIREIRQERQWTIAKLAAALDLEPHEIAAIETGSAKVTKEYLARLFDCLGLTMEERVSIVKLAYGRRNRETRKFYKERAERHNRSERAIPRFSEWGPEALSILRLNVDGDGSSRVVNG